MLNLALMSSKGDEALKSSYLKSIDMALESCQAVKDQFKLIETPINSFLLVTNVLPDDSRPWERSCNHSLDFSNLRKDFDLGDSPVDFSSVYPGPERREENEEVGKCTYSDKYLVYQEIAWSRALTLNRDEVINEAMRLMSNPKNWTALVPEDPLPCFWMLFHGLKSFCESTECLYARRFGVPGPILFPPHIYTPAEDINSFVNSACKYFKELYSTADFTPSAYPHAPFELARAKACLKNLQGVDSGCSYLSRLCLLCQIYRQNKDINESSSFFEGAIILAGGGANFLGDACGVSRDICTGDSILAPRYNISLILKHLEKNGRQ